MPRKSIPGQPLRSPRTVVRKAVAPPRRPLDPNAIYPATRDELRPIALASVVLGFLALMVVASRGWMLLYGDAVAHLGIARRILDARYPGIAQLGGVWLPLPHLLMLPFVQRMDWWQNGVAGAWPSLLAYAFANTGCYALARKLVPPAWAFAATAFFALNPNLMYLATTAMTEPLFLALMLWHPTAVIVPSEAIDEVWHTHVLNTARYAADCETIFGRFKHHFPTFGQSEEVLEEQKKGQEETLRLFEEAFGAILDGAVPDEDIASFLIALSDRGETASEIAGAARAMRARLIPIRAPENAIDVCGTGAMGTTRSMYPLPSRWSSPPAACRWPSMATARPHRNPARPTC